MVWYLHNIHYAKLDGLDLDLHPARGMVRAPTDLEASSCSSARPAGLRAGRAPNVCAQERHDRIVHNHTPLYGPLSGYRFAGRDLVAPDGQRLSVTRLEGLLWRDAMELRRAGFASRKAAGRQQSVKVATVNLQDYRHNGLAAG